MALSIETLSTTDGAALVVAIVGAVLNILALVLILSLGYFIARAVSALLGKLMHKAKLEQYLESHGVEDALGSVKISNVLEKVVKWYIVLIFLQIGTAFLDLGPVAQYIGAILVFVPILLGALLFFVFTIIVGEYVKEKMIEFQPKSPLVNLSAKAVKLLISYMGFTVAVGTIGFDTPILTQTFVAVLQGLSLGVGLAVGIAFGLGGQEEAKELIDKTKKNLKI